MPAEPSADLPRRLRLRGRDAFGRIFREGEGLRRGEVVLKYLAQPARPEKVRAGFVVRRSVGSAVRRNRLRRLLREAYRHERHALEARLSPGAALDLLLLWNGSAEQALRPSLERIRRDLRQALDRLALRLEQRDDQFPPR